MANGLGALRPARRAGRGHGRERGRPTIREVCLVGMDHRPGDEGWAAGQEVTWQGRGYRVVAAVSAEPCQSDSPRHYVYLAPMLGG
jgi:hypothetical protein